MSSIVTEQGVLHYESIGRGRPIILLHGWINSWDVWRDLMIALAKTGKYRVYALDFWGFGDSTKVLRSSSHSYQIDSYAKMVHEFMNTLGIVKAPIFGHSMGGTVALQMSLTYPDSVERVTVVGSPIIGSSLHPFLRLAGYGALAKLVWRYPIMLHSIMRILLAQDSRKVRDMISRDVQRTTIESFFRSIGDLRETDLREKLTGLTMPALGIYGVKDNIVKPKNGELLQNNAPAAQVTMMQHSRHFPMTDEPDKFLNVIDRFLATDAEMHPNGNGTTKNSKSV